MYRFYPSDILIYIIYIFRSSAVEPEVNSFRDFSGMSLSLDSSLHTNRRSLETMTRNSKSYKEPLAIINHYGTIERKREYYVKDEKIIEKFGTIRKRKEKKKLETVIDESLLTENL